MAEDDTNVAIARLTFLESARSHENDLLAQRATWLVLAQSFLFATFAIVSDQLGTHQEAATVTRELFHVIPIVGLSIAILVQLAVVAAVYMLWSFHRQLVALSESPEMLKLRWPTARRPVSIMILGQLPALVAPLGLASVWIVLLAQPLPGPH